MARGGVADESIALRVDSSADLTGIRAARQETTGLGKDARAAAAQMAAGAQDSATAQRTIAGAAREAASAQDKVTISTAQSRALWAQAGGDYAKFVELLRAHVAQQQALASATMAAAAAQQQQNRAIAAAPPPPPGGGGPPHGPWPSGPMQGPALPAAAESVARVAAEVDKIPSKARSAANAMTTLALAAADGSGGLRSIGFAAGTAADGLAVLSGNARLAAGAAGIGALVTIATTAILLLDRLGDKARSLNLGENLSGMTEAAFEARFKVIQERFDRQAARVAGAEAISEGTPAANVPAKVAALLALRQERQRLEEYEIELAAASEERDRRASDRRRGISEAATERAKRDAERADELNRHLTESHQAAMDRMGMSEADAAAARLRRQGEAQLREIEQLQVSEDEKRLLRLLAEQDTQAQIDAIRKAAADKEKKDRERQDKEREDKEKRARDRQVQIIESALQASTSAGESLAKTLTRMALTPLVKYLEGLAAEQMVKAGVAAWSLDLAGAARHASAAALAAAGARKVAQIGGLGSGGGGDSSYGGGGGAMLSGSRGERAGDVTVIVQTIDPTSREVMGQTAYYLQRSGTLKRPTNLPLVTGPSSVAGAYVA